MFKFVSKMINMAKEQSPEGDDDDIKVVSKVVSTSESPGAQIEIKSWKNQVEEEIIFCATINRNTI